MTKFASSVRRLGLKLVLLALIGLPGVASAQYTAVFQYNQVGDVLAGFRRSGNLAGQYQMVADLGNVTNLIKLSVGTTITVTNFTPGQLADAFTNYNNLQWSVFSAGTVANRSGTGWVTPLGTFPGDSVWWTLPGTNVNTQTLPPPRETSGSQGNYLDLIYGVFSGAFNISADFPESVDNTNSVVREPSSSQYALSVSIADELYPTNGDFGSQGTPLTYSVENNTGASFSAAQRSDFYQLCALGGVDPINNSTTNTYFVGYFLLNPNGTMTFTRAAAVTPPPSVSSVSASATNGFGPLTVVFSDSTSGSATNWVWNFGNGTIITNTTAGNVTNTYTTSGSYTVTLTVYGPGGSTSYTVANFIVTSPTPKINFAAINGKLVFTGTNCPATVQYRILTSSNLMTALPNWKPIYTNSFANNGTFAYTNTPTTNSFFILVSP